MADLPSVPPTVAAEEQRQQQQQQQEQPEQQPHRGGSSARRRNHRSSGQRSRRNRPPVTCVICYDEVSRDSIIQVPCGHQYCEDCLRQNFAVAVADEASFPPRCCQRQIRLSVPVRFHLTDDLIKRFNECNVEFNTRNRTYCHVAQCSTFIEPKYVSVHVAQCPRCYEKTCTICKQRAHKSGNCPRDESVQEVIALGMEKGWKRCYICGLMVELLQGCNHMSCRCGAQFCYVCGKRWKTCPCSQFRQHEHNAPFGPNTQDDAAIAQRLQLEEDHNHAVRLQRQQQNNLRQPPPQPGFPLPDPDRQRELLVQTAVGMIEEENQECTHASWKRTRRREWHCEQCYRIFPYIFECTGCQTQMCRRCKDGAVSVRHHE